MGGEGGKARMKAESRGVYNAARYWKGEGEQLRFMEHAMELDAREAEIADPFSIQGLETFLMY